MTPFWVIFLQDPSTGVIHGTAYAHNATADYKNNPHYIGMKKIEIDLSELVDGR